MNEKQEKELTRTTFLLRRRLLAIHYVFRRFWLSVGLPTTMTFLPSTMAAKHLQKDAGFLRDAHAKKF